MTEEKNGLLYLGSTFVGAAFLYNPFVELFCFASVAAAPALLGIAGIGLIVLYGSSKSKFSILFKNLKLGTSDDVYPLLKNRKENENSIDYKFTLPAGLCSADFEKKKENIEAYIGKPIEIKTGFKYVEIKEYKKDMPSLIHYVPMRLSGDVPVLIGYDRAGNVLSADLAAGEPHVLIAGETGSGKSTIIRAVITNILLHSDVTMHLVDLKSGAELNVFRRCKNVQTFCRDVPDTRNMLFMMVSETDRRYSLFYDNNVKDIREYNKLKGVYPLPYEIIVIDEYADLQREKDCFGAIELLARKARACGIYLVLSTQRPDANVLSGAIKCNITNIVGLKTLNGTNSSIILGQPGLENLPGKGRGILKRAGVMTEFQAPLLTYDFCRELVSKLYVNEAAFVPETYTKGRSKYQVDTVESIDFESLEVFK